MGYEYPQFAAGSAETGQLMCGKINSAIDNILSTEIEINYKQLN